MRAPFHLECVMSDKRLDDLEIRFAHQEKQLAELNDIVTAQWKRIDLLESQNRRLREDFQNLDVGNNGPEPKPPHY